MEQVLLERLTDADLPVMFGRYELQSLLGEGGMAKVFRAELRGPAGFRKQVALKVIKAETTAQTKREDINDLIKEACLGGRLKHPNLVDVYELGEVNGQLFISMELVDGVALNRLVRMGVEIPPSVLMEIAVAITAGLVKAHGLVGDDGRVGLVHRDLKPHNILLSWDGAIKVGDFGAAIMRREVSPIQGPAVRTVCGTPSYMSPEQIRGRSVDGRSDLFALALVVSAMVLGENPLGRKYVLNRISAGEELVPPLLTNAVIEELNEAAPGLGPVLLGCLEPDRSRRTSTAEQLMRDFRAIQDRVGHNPRLTDWLPTVARGGDTQVLWQNTVHMTDAGAKADSFDELKTVVFASSSGSRTNLGPQLDGYVGRVNELSELAKCFDEGVRLVTLKGTGGAGKTRLSRRYARTQIEILEGGAWFVDLTEARSPKGVVHAAAVALEVPLGGADFDGLVTQMGYAIAGRGPVLMVLDNFEQVVNHAAETIGRWQSMAPEARFLVTSRESLRLPGEQIFSLSPLSESEAAVLFELRARAAGASWLETAEIRDAITGIVQQLDGLPLAIELAAARAKLLSPVQIRDRLDQRFELLRQGRRGQSERQSSLRGLIDWSWELLKPWEQAALAQLSVFHDGFSMEAAEAVLDLSSWPEAPWSLDVVGSLIDKSLVHARDIRGHNRLSMYVSIQEYAAQKLGDQTSVTASRHASFFSKFGTVSYLESTNTHGGVQRFQVLITELENLLAGMNAALKAGNLSVAAQCGIAAAEVFQMHGPTVPGLELIERLLAQPVTGQVRARLHLLGGQLLRHSGRLSDAREMYTEAISIAQHKNERRLEGVLLTRLGWLSILQSLHDEAMDHFQNALAIHREVGDRMSEGGTLGRMGWLHYRRGNIPEATDHYRRALAIHREIGNRKAEGVQLGNMALMLCEQGQIDEALGSYQRSLSIHREIGNRRAEADGMANLAILHVQQGRFAEAMKHYKRGRSINKLVGNRRGEARVCGNLASLYFEMGEFDKVREHHERALEVYRDIDDVRGLSETLGNLGDFFLQQGEIDLAEQHFVESIAFSNRGHPLCIGVFSASLAMVRLHQNRIDEACALVEHGESFVRGVHQLEMGKFLCKKARVFDAAGNREVAVLALNEAKSIAESLDGGSDSVLVVAIKKTSSDLNFS